MTITFEKWSGAGNDFVLLEAGDLPPGRAGAELARLLCRRGFGVGADGLIVIDGAHADYWNSDGSPAAFCGNGARCVARYLLQRDGSARDQVAFTLGAVPTRAWIEDQGGGEITGDVVAVAVPAPRGIDRRIAATGVLAGDVECALGRRILDAAWVDAGVPHLVLLLDGEPRAALDAVAQPLQDRPPFAPAGTNLTCVWLSGAGGGELRTWERGVRAETLACGSAALAAAWLLFERGEHDRASLRTKGGASLTVERREDGWVLRGPAVKICRGTALIPAA
jgi:diaminopimelate epimerase